VALIVALAGPPVLVLASRRVSGDTPPLSIEVAFQILYCGMAAFVLWVLMTRERLPLASIGIRRPSWSTLAWAAGLLAAVQLLPFVTRPLVQVLGTRGLNAGLSQLAAVPLWFRLVLAITGGIIEETLYRGYAIERMAALTNRRWLAGVISATVFGVAHIPYWGVGFAVAADLPFGILMTAFYLWRRDLVANMLAHSGALVLAMVTVV
jgi:membrane protease YdiL (CAAX protease family)